MKEGVSKPSIKTTWRKRYGLAPRATRREGTFVVRGKPHTAAPRAEHGQEMVVCSFRQCIVLPFFILTVMLSLAECSSVPRTPYTTVDAASSRVLNLTGLRRYSDEPASAFLEEAHWSLRRGAVTYLALSGGGADGAFGAGVLNGWSAAGTRPKFSVVSGVSTGALIAPFAFLGPAYDATLRDAYTTDIAESLVDSPSLINAVFRSGLFENSRLRDLVARYVDQDMLAAIAAEHAKGRDLFVVTTNLDTQRTVIWDMGRIAAIGSSQALSLFRDVIAASASIPVVFSPILIDAAANGHHFQEMHADGGVMEPVLTLPETFLLRNGALARGPRMNIYILVNNTVERDFQLVPNSTIDIAARTSASVTKTQTRSILHETFEFARRNNFGFNLTYIDKNFPSPSLSGFETSYMRALYEYGYDKARGGNLWASAPPSDNALPSDFRSRRSAKLQ
jgi:predicted acylesterase/phospholipase RssA